MAGTALRRDRRGSRPGPAPVESSEVIAGRFDGSVEAEVARAMLEGAGVSCRLAAAGEKSHELYVKTEDAAMAEAVLRPEKAPAVKISTSVKCTLCGVRDSRGQAWIFWSALLVVIVTLIPVGLRFSHAVLFMTAAIAALVLAGLELSFKDYRCNRCGKHFRLQRRRAVR